MKFCNQKGKKDAVSVSSCYSVNSAIMCNLEMMIKMSFAITLILTAIMNIVNFFQITFKTQKAMLQLMNDT